jgi:hypothetical protein
VKFLPTAFALLSAGSIACSREYHSPAAAPVGSAEPQTSVKQQPSVAEPVAEPLVDDGTSSCNEQSPQEFLQRAHLNHAAKSRSERAEMLHVRAQAIAYRTAQYGYFDGFGERKANSKSPGQQSKGTTFFGLPVVIHERVIPALKCVEQRLIRDCAEFDYKPKNLSGLRKKNTYIDGEVSNHVYGIAIDIDPLKNPCCKCLEPWSSSERCRGNKPVWERMAMPRCWVDTFERFGFYWLGHDVLEDTMHFEFLGDPDRIRRQPDDKP